MDCSSWGCQVASPSLTGQSLPSPLYIYIYKCVYIMKSATASHHFSSSHICSLVRPLPMGTLVGVLYFAMSTPRIHTIVPPTFRSPTATVAVGPCRSPYILTPSPRGTGLLDTQWNAEYSAAEHIGIGEYRSCYLHARIL